MLDDQHEQRQHEQRQHEQRQYERRQHERRQHERRQHERNQYVATAHNLIAAGYDKRASYFLERIAQRLVELVQPKPEAVVLDVISGHMVGLECRVEKLVRTRQRLTGADWSTVTFREGDLGQLPFDDNTFDLVFCSSAIFWLPELLASLRTWRRVLKTGGIVAFSSYGGRSFQPLAKLFETAIGRYGATLPTARYPRSWERLTDLEAYSDLLRHTAFSVIDVRGEQLGYYLATQEDWWEILAHSHFRDLLAQLTPDALVQFKAEHLAAVAELATAQGIWLNVATIFVVGQKS